MSFRIEVDIRMNIHKAFVDLKPNSSGCRASRDHKWRKKPIYSFCSQSARDVREKKTIAKNEKPLEMLTSVEVRFAVELKRGA